ncbi:hypothetical protein L596_003662 [Steinernema carpocapsae]|uniref:Uncharacterized protein n=1 Tax=Steinernema carpocapsae TaxID=34508 RepID=A0A4U8UUX0_STECR|nr:hypothetical protein L596_003662 [Steinernema carpocapsae]
MPHNDMDSYFFVVTLQTRALAFCGSNHVKELRKTRSKTTETSTPSYDKKVDVHIIMWHTVETRKSFTYNNSRRNNRLQSVSLLIVECQAKWTDCGESDANAGSVFLEYSFSPDKRGFLRCWRVSEHVWAQCDRELIPRRMRPRLRKSAESVFPAFFTKYSDFDR